MKKISDAFFRTIKAFTWIDEASLKNYVQNSTLLVVERSIRVFVGFAVGVYVARFLGPENFGLLSFALSFITLFSALATLGFDVVLVKSLVEAPSDEKVLVGTALRLRLLGSLSVVVLAGLLLLAFPQGRSTSLLIIISSFTFLFQSLNVIDLFYQSKILSKRIIIPQVVQIIVSAIFKCLLVYFQAPLSWFAFAFVFDSVILGLGLIAVYFKYSGPVNIFCYDVEIARQLLRTSFPLILSEFAISVYMRVDQVIIKTLLGNAMAGYYAAAIVICEAFYFLPLAIIRTFFPVILNNKKQDADLYNQNVQKLYDLMVMMSVVVIVFISFFADRIVSMLFGAEFMEAVPVLRIYVWSSLFVYLGAANERWLLAENFQKIMFYRTLGGCVISVILNLILVPWLNIAGSAVSAIISFAFVVLFSILIFKPTRAHFKTLMRSFNIISGFRRIFNV